MPNDITLLIVEAGTASPTELRAELANANLPGFLLRAGGKLRLVAEDELDGTRDLAELGVAVAIADEPLGGARYSAVDIRAMHGSFGPGAQIVGEARVKRKRPQVLGMVVGGVVVYHCRIGPHTVLAHRVGRDRKCPQHPTQTVDP